MTTNYEMFLDTVSTLAGSQGFYSRLQTQINNWTEEQKEQAKNYWNSKRQFKDSVDLVLFLEGGEDEDEYKYGKKILKQLTLNVFGSYFTFILLEEGNYYNVHILSEFYRDEELNTLRYQEEKSCVSLDDFDELRMTKDIIEFAMWNKFYGFKNKSYNFCVQSEVDIDDLENF
jgi:hypothetical protein